MSHRAMRRPGQLVDPACPINWSHWSNLGLSGEWASVPNPGWRGGRTFRDLVRGGHTPHDGTLTNMAFPATTTSGWQGSRGRPGGYGCLAFDGTDDYVDGTAQVTAAVDNFAVSAWVNPAILPQGGMFLSIGDGGGTAHGYGFSISSGFGGSGSSLQILFPGINWYTPGYTFATAGIWYHVLVTRRGGTTYSYVNGLEQVTTTTDTPGAPSAYFGIGARNEGGGTFDIPFRGSIDGAAVWSRAFTPSQVLAMFLEQKRGNPSRWRWLPRRAWSVQPSAAVSGLLMKRRRALC